MNFLDAIWAWLNQNPAYGLTTLTLILGGIGTLIKWRLDRLSGRAEIAKTDSEGAVNAASAAQINTDTAISLVKTLKQELVDYRSEAKEAQANLVQAVESANMRVTDLQTISLLQQKRHERLEGRLERLQANHDKLNDDLNTLQVEHTTLDSQYRMLKAAHDALQADHIALWDYALQWEAAIMPEDGETQARIKARIDKVPPLNGGKHTSA